MKGRVLIIEDELELAELIGMYLQRDGICWRQPPTLPDPTVAAASRIETPACSRYAMRCWVGGARWEPM